MSGMNTGGPYRSFDFTNKPISIVMDTDDIEFIVHYLNSDNTIQQETCKYIGTPSASYTHRGDKSLNDGCGSGKFRTWLEYSSKYNTYSVNEHLVIPSHRLVKITKTITARQENVEIIKPNVMD